MILFSRRRRRLHAHTHTLSLCLSFQAKEVCGMCSTRERERDTKVLECVISFSAQLRATKKVVAEEVSPPKKSFTRPRRRT